MKSLSKKYFTSNSKAAYLFLAPSISAIFIFFFLPVLAAFTISFTDFDIYTLGDWSTLRFVGLKNYIKLIDDPLFWQALQNTFYYVVAAAPLSIAISLGAALLLN